MIVKIFLNIARVYSRSCFSISGRKILSKYPLLSYLLLCLHCIILTFTFFKIIYIVKPPSWFLWGSLMPWHSLLSGNIIVIDDTISRAFYVKMTKSSERHKKMESTWNSTATLPVITMSDSTIQNNLGLCEGQDYTVQTQ